MKTTIQLSLACAGLLVTAGCVTTGLSSAERPGVTYPNYILSLQPRQTSSGRPTLTAPLRIAVAQVGESAPPQCLLDKLESEPLIVKSAVGIPVPGEDAPFVSRNIKPNKPNDYSIKLQSLCRLAQSVGADYVFIVGGEIDSWQSGNALKFLDFTIVGGAIVPSTKIHAEVRAAGALVDAATGEAVLLVSAETKSSAVSPTFLADGKTDTVKSKLRDEMSVRLGDALLQKISAYQQTASTK
jgi:hypothetical protein